MAEILRHPSCKHKLEIKGAMWGKATTLTYATCQAVQDFSHQQYVMFLFWQPSFHPGQFRKERVFTTFLPSRAVQEESDLPSLYNRWFMLGVESYQWFKDLDLFSRRCTFRDMAPKLTFAMKSPRPKLIPRPRLRVNLARVQSRRVQRTQTILKFRATINSFSLHVFPGLMIQGLNHSRPFTMEWQGMIPRGKSLLLSEARQDFVMACPSWRDSFHW